MRFGWSIRDIKQDAQGMNDSLLTDLTGLEKVREKMIFFFFWYICMLSECVKKEIKSISGGYCSFICDMCKHVEPPVRIFIDITLVIYVTMVLQKLGEVRITWISSWVYAESINIVSVWQHDEVPNDHLSLEASRQVPAGAGNKESLQLHNYEQMASKQTLSNAYEELLFTVVARTPGKQRWWWPPPYGLVSI